MPNILETTEPEEPKEQKSIVARRTYRERPYPIFKYSSPIGFCRRRDGEKKPYPIFLSRTSKFVSPIPSAIQVEESPYAATKTFSESNEPQVWKHYTAAELVNYGKQPIPDTGPIGLDYDGKQTGHAQDS